MIDPGDDLPTHTEHDPDSGADLDAISSGASADHVIDVGGDTDSEGFIELPESA